MSGETPKIKVCGMREAQNIRDVAALGPDYMGFIFFKESPRFVGEDFGSLLVKPPIQKIGIFVNETLDLIIQKVEEAGLEGVQLHGDETPEYCRELRALRDQLLIIKSFNVGEDFDFTLLGGYHESCDMFLFDSKGAERGGSGVSFDWNILERYDQKTPFILAGGLGPQSLPELKTLCKRGFNLHAFDFNSQLEVSAGLKDLNLVKKVIEEIRK
jgi:phosphoribosylanthranilate isomerase